MAVTVPSWFKGRQGKAAEAGLGLLRLTAPNLKEWFLGIRRDGDGWLGFLRDRADGPDAIAVDLGNIPEHEAWAAAFEVYRNHIIV